MKIAKAFSFIFQDPNWVTKVMIGAGIWFSAGFTFSLTGAFLIGYGLEVSRRVIAGDENPLPAWSNLGQRFVDGLLWLFVSVIYFIPAVIIYLVGGTLAQRSQIAFLIVMLLVLAIEIGGAMFSLAALGLYAGTGKTASLFQFGKIFNLVKNNMPVYLTLALAGNFGMLLIYAVGALACGVGLFAAGPIAQMFIGHLVGQAYLEASKKTGGIETTSKESIGV